MNPQIEELLAEKERNEHEIDQLEHTNTLIHNRISYLTEGERKKRNHRLITRGAAVESLLPGVKGMDEVEFYEFMERVLTDPTVAPLLSEVTDNGAVPLSHDPG